MTQLTISERQLRALRNVTQVEALVLKSKFPLGNNEWLTADEMEDLARRLDLAVNPLEEMCVPVQTERV